MPTQHAKLGASSSAKWLECPGALALESRLNLPEEESSVFAAEGTAAHALGEFCLLNLLSPHDLIGEEFEGFTVDAEMANAVAVHVDYVRSIDGVMLVEEKVDYSKFVPEGFGTSDIVLIHQDDDLLEVIDYKHGKGIEVLAKGNSQGRLYCVGALETFDVVLGHIKRVRITIVQPRMDNISVEELTVEELYSWVTDYVAPRARISYDLLHGAEEIPEGSFNPSEKACRWCRAFGSCPAAAEANLKIAMEGFEDLTEIDSAEVVCVDAIDLETRGKVQKLLSTCKKWLEAFSSETHRLIAQGHDVPGFKLVKGNGKRSWESPEAAKKAMRSAGLKKPEYTVESLLSPAQAEKKVVKEKKPKLEKAIVRTEGNPILVESSDKRDSIPTGGDCFEDLTNEPKTEG